MPLITGKCPGFCEFVSLNEYRPKNRFLSLNMWSILVSKVSSLCALTGLRVQLLVRPLVVGNGYRLTTFNPAASILLDGICLFSNGRRVLELAGSPVVGSKMGFRP